MQRLLQWLPACWQDAVLAALIGDAVGVPHEFKAGRELPLSAHITMVMPESYPKTYENIPYGRWSDDGSQLLALLEVLVHRRGFYDEGRFLRHLLGWAAQGLFQAGGTVFDIGGQTSSALARRARGQLPVELPPGYCGNGSLMRVLPVAALPDAFGIAPAMAIQAAMAQSDLTHPQSVGRAACALYVELCWLFLERPGGPVASLADEAMTRLRQRDVLRADDLQGLDVLDRFKRHELPSGSGYVANTFWSALLAVERASSVSEALRQAVALGHDTDTVACVAGGLAGLRWGLDSTSCAWLAQMDVDFREPPAG